ncbi:hypothetical protein [Erythrobacter sp. SG61-1L]|uniref:hypothetical protein n=1 Tax=Erythrobacter sp. SG61-1L TaxID=1603897 RepID=UPI0012E17248|nr:hypothetical protein [Erythrobacter sp. SG61-1L]
MAARIGLSAQTMAEIEAKNDASLVEDPLNPLVRYRVRPDPDWTERLGEAWNNSLVNSRRLCAGTIALTNGLLTIADGDLPHDGFTTKVNPGEYEITLIIAHMGDKRTDDYEEHISHAFALLQPKHDVVSISSLMDEHGKELGIAGRFFAFAGSGVLQEVAGGHAGRWTLRVMDLFREQASDEENARSKSIRIENKEGSSAAILFHGGHSRGDYPAYRLADAEDRTVGVMLDFFVDNRPW